MTSLPPEKQLILELERQMLLDEGVDVLPGRRGRRLALPLDEDLLDAARQPSVYCTFRLRDNRAMVDGWQRRRCLQWRAHELLQEADVEDVMEACARWQL